jgi:hypothetical protein
MPDSEPEHRVTEHTQIRLSLADLLAELALGAMAREVEMNEPDERAEISASTSMGISEPPAQPG